MKKDPALKNKEKENKENKEKEKKRKEKKKDTKVVCGTHSQEYLFYCCNKLLCALCLLDHRSHPFQSVEEALKLQREKLPPLNSELDRVESQVNQYIAYKGSQRDQLLMSIAALNEEIGRGQKKKNEITEMREKIKDTEEDMEDAAFFIGPSALEGGGLSTKTVPGKSHSPGGGEVVVDKLKEHVDNVLGDFAEELRAVLEESKNGAIAKVSLGSSRAHPAIPSVPPPSSSSSGPSLSSVGPSLSYISKSPSQSSTPPPFKLDIPTQQLEFGSTSKTPRIDKKRVTKRL